MVAQGQVTAPPVGKPTVYADAVSESMIAVKWTDVEGETQYRIERRGGTSSQWVEVGAVGGNSANFNDTGLAPRTIYAYRVRGWNEAGFGEYSNEAAATTWPPPGVKPAATRVVDSGGTDTTMVLQWDLVDLATGYSLEMTTGATGTWAEVANVAHPKSFVTVSNLTASTEYSWRIRAYNASGFSPYSAVWTARTLPPPPPSAELGGVALSYNQLELRWKDVLTNKETMLTYIGYRLQVPDGADWKDLSYRGVDETNYVVGGLLPATEYSFRMRAENGLPGDWSYVTLKTQDAPPIAPQAPVINADGVSSNSVRVKWQDVELETEYRIERKNSAGDWVQIATVPANTLFYVDSGLAPSMTYSYRVRAANGSGASAYSNESGGTTLPDTTQWPFSILPMAVSQNGVTFVVQGPAGQKFKVQSSSDFRNWNDETDALTMTARGSFGLSLAKQPELEKGFYRTVTVP